MKLPGWLLPLLAFIAISVVSMGAMYRGITAQAPPQPADKALIETVIYSPQVYRITDEHAICYVANSGISCVPRAAP